MLGALNRFGTDKIDFVQVRHEEMAAFMASAYAKFTGELGVCLATSGPGASHLITGLYDARLDHMPVLAIVGQQARTAVGAHCQQELDLVSMFKDVAGAFVQQAMVPAQVRHLVDSAVRIARSERRVTALVIPNDPQEEPYEEPPRKHGATHSGVGYTAPKVVPYEADLRRAADVLNAGKKIAMLVGAGTLGAAPEVIAVADRLGAGCAKALLGKAALPDDVPWVTGSIGLLGTKPSWNLMTECDTLLMMGSGFPYSEFLPKEGTARGVQIDIKADMLSLRYPMEVPLVGDAAETLRLLLPMLQPRADNAWRERIAGWNEDWQDTIKDRAMHSANPVNPQRPFLELSPRLPDRAILTSDSGSCANWYARDIKMRSGMMAFLSGGLASMGAPVPYAIAAKIAHPDRPVIAMVGDGAMQMNNQDLNQVSWEQRVMNGDPKFDATQQLPDVPYHKFAELIGLRGIYVDDPDWVGPAWDEALASDRPVVLEIRTDPNVPPLPLHITLAQARAFTSTLLKGDPEEGSVLLNSAKEMLASVLPGGKS